MMVESHCIGIMFFLSTLATNSTESFTGAMLIYIFTMTLLQRCIFQILYCQVLHEALGHYKNHCVVGPQADQHTSKEYFKKNQKTNLIFISLSCLTYFQVETMQNSKTSDRQWALAQLPACTSCCQLTLPIM